MEIKNACKKYFGCRRRSSNSINKFLEIDHEVRAIVFSGYSGGPVLSNFQKYGFKGIILKLFGAKSLGKVLHEVLKGEKNVHHLYGVQRRDMRGILSKQWSVIRGSIDDLNKIGEIIFGNGEF